MNFTLILFGGSFIFLVEKGFLTDYREYYPYFLLLVYGLFALEIYKIQVFQAYRKYLADCINRELKENLINTPYLTYKFILHPIKNIFYTFYILMWIVVLVASYYFSHSHCTNGFWTTNAIVQVIIIVPLLILFIYKLFCTKAAVIRLLNKRSTETNTPADDTDLNK